MKLALIGKDISHSLSKKIYQKLIEDEFSYTLIDIANEDLLPRLDSLAKEFDGVSVTSPYKSFYFPKLIKPLELNEIGIINTIRFSRGYPEAILTDLIAFREVYQSINIKNMPIKILGDGCMGRMIAHELSSKSINYATFSRKKNNLDQVSSEPSLFINTCSRDYVFNKKIDSNSIFWDFNYNFKPHLNLQNNCVYIDGLSLLEKQARHALDFWQSK